MYDYQCPMEIVLATRNKKKVEEISRILEGAPITILTLDDFPSCPEVEEDEPTFRGNAIKKAVAIAQYTGRAAVSDDSGIEVDALNGEPGVYSARYAGEGAGDKANLDKLLQNLKGVPAGQRGGRFVCVIAFALPDGRVETFEGIVEGTVGEKPAGSGGFGYDPAFYPMGHDRSFGEMAPDEKDALSHRRIALDKLCRRLKKIAATGK
jgi:XTP/dITP diphosphohydrolase